MQPLKLLNNVQKARLLHSLFLLEIPHFLGYLDEMTKSLLKNRDKVIAEWHDQLFGVEFWFVLAEQSQKVLAKYPKELCKSPHVFADQLFDGYNAIFTAHALTQYVALDRHTEPKFKPAVELLFS